MATRQGTKSTTTFGPNIIPSNLLDLINQSIGQIGAFQQQFPLATLMGNLAEQIVPLSPTELGLLGQQIATSQAPSMTAPEFGALSDINQLVGGPIGQAPATLAAEKAFNQLVAPQIAQQAALAGQTQGGAMLEQMSQAQTQALVPFLQQEEQNRLNVLQPLLGLGGELANRERGDVATALAAAGAPRQIAQEQATSNWEDMLRKAGLLQGLGTGVFSQFAPFTVTPGPQTTLSSSKTTQPGIWSSLGKK
jgi:hypothetical protein